MSRGRKTESQPTNDIVAMRQRIAELEASEAEHKRVQEALRQSEEELRKSEAQYRLLAENVKDVIWTSDMNWRFTYLSPSFRPRHGYTVEEAMEIPIEKTMTPASLEVALKVHQEEMAIEMREHKDLNRSRKVEVEQYCRDGSTVWSEMEVTFLRNADGQAVGILGVARDITERKQAEKALRESEERYRLIAENATDIIWTMDMDGRFTYISPSVTRRQGFSVEEAMAMPTEKNLTIASLEAAMKIFEEEMVIEMTEHKDPFRSRKLEVEQYCKDGSLVWSEIEMTALRDQDGQPLGILGVSRDITERKKAEETLARHARRQEALHAVAQAVSQTLDLGQLLDSTLEKTVEAMDTDIGNIYLLAVPQRAFQLQTHKGMPAETVKRVATVELGEEELQSILRSTTARAPLSQVHSDTILSRVAQALRREGIPSVALVPLSVRGELQGVLSVCSLSQREFTHDDTELLAAIGNEIAVGMDNSRLLEQTRQLSVTDDLTGLYNRRRFYEVLEGEMNRTRRYGRSFCVAVIDLDGFKAYNDKFGHTAGDTALESFARTLGSALRKTDVAFRYGGDEFAIMLPATEASRASKIVDRVRSEWSHAPGVEHVIPESPLGFSAGIAQFPEDAETADGLVFLADTALFHSKRKGGYKSTLVAELGTVSTDVLDTATLDQIYALAATVDARDPLTYGHSQRVAAIVETMGNAIGLPPDELANLHAAALLHDIGKVGVPDAILVRPETPVEREWSIIQQHSAEGARIVGHIGELAVLVPIIRHHHERYDGTGYPDGLKGEEIPLGARIIGIADAYDTMTTPRPYRDVISRKEACEELQRCAGAQFDPGLVETLCMVADDATRQRTTH